MIAIKAHQRIVLMQETVSAGHTGKAIEFDDCNQIICQSIKRSYTLAQDPHENLFC